MKRKSTSLSKADVERFEELQSHLAALSTEVSALTKKSPDGPMNRFKIGLVNERLRLANEFLKGIHRPFEGFQEFDETELPSASDVAVVISQYLNSLEGWRSYHVVKVGYSWYWNTPEGDLVADPPSRFRKAADH